MTNDQSPFSPIDAPQPAHSPSDETRSLRPSIENRIHPTFISDEEPLAASDQQVGAVARREESSSGGILWEITETLVLALLIFLAVRTVVLNFRVDGLSMEPTLDTGQMLLVNRQIYFHFDLNEVLNVLPFVDREGEHIIYPLHPPQRGDIIVFDPPIHSTDKPYIKRVIGLPGERVSIRDGSVYINGERLDEEYLGSTSTSWPGRPDDFELLIPEEHVFVMGDNRNNSTDSRSFGPIPYSDIIGRAWISYWPSDLLGIFQTPDYRH
ncbi:MAG TPA: signal peptidase I [Thermomicrobiales bacterium]|nr:signal peptidase I [Thermomicrobiales bacterium]